MIYTMPHNLQCNHQHQVLEKLEFLDSIELFVVAIAKKNAGAKSDSSNIATKKKKTIQKNSRFSI